jgi:hypothetical protein
MHRITNYNRLGITFVALFLAAMAAGLESRTSATALSPTIRRLGPEPINLGTAADYVILAKSGITNVPHSAIDGNLGVSPIAAAAITGFSLIHPAGSPFALSAQVTGKVYAADYGLPTPTYLNSAVLDMQTAYLNGAGIPGPDYDDLARGNIGGLTLRPGLYKWDNTVTILKNVTLNGGPNDVWIFQIAGSLSQASATRVFLTGGAQAKNIFWVVAGVVALGTTAHIEGEVLSKTAITLNTGASAHGRLLAQTDVTLIMNTVVQE